jgi:hypothetical protein
MEMPMTENETMLNKSQAAQETAMIKINAKMWRALLKIAGSQIDPETAEVCWHHGQVVDPYGVYVDLPAECDCVGRLFFARNPGSEVWIEFGDLPEATRNALESRRPDCINSALTDCDIPF